MSPQPEYRRLLHRWERHTDFVALDDSYTAALVAAEAVLRRYRRRQLRALDTDQSLEQVRQDDVLRALVRRATAAARAGAVQAQLEARRQRQRVGRVRLTEGDREQIAAAAAAAVAILATRFQRAVTRQASRSQLQTVGIRDAARRASGPAVHIGRVRVLTIARPRLLYASELLDGRTCAACDLIDGTRFDSLEEALQIYPYGGYRGCFGSHRCRGTLVAEYAVAARAA